MSHLPAVRMSYMPQDIFDGTRKLSLGNKIKALISLPQLLIYMVEIRFLSYSHRDNVEISALVIDRHLDAMLRALHKSLNR